MSYLHPSQLFCNTFHFAIRNTMTPGCQYIVFIPVYAPLIAIHILYQAMPELASPVQQRHHLPHPSGFFYPNSYLFACFNNSFFYTHPSICILFQMPFLYTYRTGISSRQGLPDPCNIISLCLLLSFSFLYSPYL